MGAPQVIADASPLILLARAGRLVVLRRLFGHLIIGPAVRDECLQGQEDRVDAQAIAEALRAGWIRVRAPRKAHAVRIERAHPGLGPGEVEALALCEDLGETDVLLDDALARRVATLLGRRPVGVLGVVMRALLSRAWSREEAGEAIRALLGGGLWVAPDILDEFREALEAAGRPDQ